MIEGHHVEHAKGTLKMIKQERENFISIRDLLQTKRSTTIKPRYRYGEEPPAACNRKKNNIGDRRCGVHRNENYIDTEEVEQLSVNEPEKRQLKIDERLNSIYLAQNFFF